MGVDIDTYRGRIGTFRYSCGQDVVTIICVINFSRGLKSVGAALFIGLLLLIAGIEANPGPRELNSFLLFAAAVVVLLVVLLQRTEWNEFTFFALCILIAACVFCYAYRNYDITPDNREDQSKDGGLQPPTLVTDQNSGAITKSRPLGEPAAKHTEEEESAQQLSLDVTADQNRNNTVAISAESTNLSDNENRDDQNKDDGLLQTLRSDQSSGAIPKSRPLGEPAENKDDMLSTLVSDQRSDIIPKSRKLRETDEHIEDQSEDDGLQLPTLHPTQNIGAIPKTKMLKKPTGKRENHSKDELQPDQSSGAIPKSRPLREPADHSIVLGHDQDSTYGFVAQSVATSYSVSKEKEYILRLIFLILSAGVPVLRDFADHQASKRGATIDKILEEFEDDRTLYNALKHKNIFPRKGGMPIGKWDISILVTFIKRVFKKDIKPDEKEAIENIRKIRNDYYAHYSQPSLTFDEYDESRKTMEDAVRTLCSPLDSSVQAKFTTIIKECETGRLNADEFTQILKQFKGEGLEICEKIEPLLNNTEIHTAFKGATFKDITRARAKEFDSQKGRAVRVCIDFIANDEDAMVIENAQCLVLKIFRENENENAEYMTIPYIVCGIKEDFNSMQNVEFQGSGSGSIVLDINVFTCTALLEVLQYIESGSLQSKLDIIADELSKIYYFKYQLKLSAALSKQTLLSLFKDFVLDGEDEENTTFLSAEAAEETIYRRTGTTDSDIGLSSDDLKEEKRDDDKDSKGRDSYFKDLTARLNLEKKRENKISIKEVISINAFENEHKKKVLSERDLPWTLLKQLISAKCNARDLTVTMVESAEDKDSKLTNWQTTLSKMKQKLNTSTGQLSALDVFIVIFQCCDPMMKRLLVQKMYLSKLAIPFMYYDFEQSKRVLSLWPLRSLTVENYSTNDSFDTIDILDLPSKVFAFARFDRPSVSKSKLLNSVLSNESCNTFFNVESLSGTSPRHLNNELIEMFWMPKVCTEKDKFEDAVVLLNLRGDIRQYPSDTCKFISNISDLFVIVINIKNLITDRTAIECAIEHFQRIIFVITHSEDEAEEVEGVLQTFIPPLEKRKEIVDVDFTYGKNMFLIADSVTAMINKYSTSERSTLEKRLLGVNNISIVSDEQSEICTKGRAIASEIFLNIELDGKSPELWKSSLTPVHFKYSPQLGKLIKKMYRATDEDQTEKFQKEIKDVRYEQLESITGTVRSFLHSIIEYQKQKPLLNFILCWLTVFIDREKRTIMPTLTKNNLNAWEERKQIVSQDSKTTAQIDENEKMIIETENAIRAASFGIENIFREIGHIYDAIIMLAVSTESKQLPSVNEVASVYADLFADGQTLEIIDGESFYMPYEWIKCVMEVATKKIESKKVFAISALGLQSSGKSTLLNTMFGLQFETSSGRCTRGINIHLVPLNQSCEKQAPFDYVLVIDTEGLRAPELMSDKHEHDNELATVITGLGDSTMINIMGENFSEMKEVLQVVVTAFLRLKLANRSLDVRKSCVLVHQNVSELSAHDKLKPALRMIKDELDRKTKESAEMHDIHDIKMFDQLIEFDMNKHVCYLPNMWQGNPPLAVVNLEYTYRVSNVKCQLIEIASFMKSKSYKTLTDLTRHANDLWKGVLTDDFVFSFRNSLEIKAFVHLEQNMQYYLSKFESDVYERILEISREKFCKCEDEKGLTDAKQSILNDIDEIWSEQHASLKTKMSNYFDKHDNKEILKQWEEFSKRSIESSCYDLLNQLKAEVDNFKEKRGVDILTKESERAHEDKIYDTSLQLAKELKGQHLEKEQLESHFNTLWDKLISDAQFFPRGTHFHQNESMRKAFINNLYSIFHQFAPMLKEQLKKTNMLSMSVPSSKLFGSFENIGITTEDIKFSKRSFHESLRDKEDIGDMVLVKADVENLLKNVDEILTKHLEIEGEISSHKVKSFVKHVNEMFQKMQEGKDYGFQKSFQIQFLVYISWYSHYRFDEHNADYRKDGSTDVRLKRYKEHMREMFYARLQDRKAEETAALLLSQTIEDVLRDAVGERLPSRIWSALSSHFPKLKSQLIIRILEDLVKKNDFKLFAQFNHTPKSYAEEWINSEAVLFLFRRDPSQYSKIASTIIVELLADIKRGIKSSVMDTSEKSGYSFEDWIRCFLTIPKKCQIPESECVRAKRELADKKLDLKNFEDILLNKLSNLETDLKSELSSLRQDTAEWSRGNFNPCEKLIKQIWGCDAQCPFCLEPCAKSNTHEGQTRHVCFQHKLRCCTGVKKVGSHAARLSSCNYDVQSKSTYRCDYLKYICNPPEQKEPCKDKNHKYRDYKKYFANWDIQPSANIEDRSKFWMWFMVRYKKKISDYYKMDTSKIPASWGNISESDALKSLRVSYTGK